MRAAAVVALGACLSLVRVCHGAAVDYVDVVPGLDARRYDCPLCDSSVYSYCSSKLLHDACCCLDPRDPSLPYQCKYADCSFLHANTCKEHRLITRCCCDRLLRL